MSGRSFLRAVQYLLLLVAVFCLSYFGWRMYEIRREQARLTAEIEKAIKPSIRPVPPVAVVPVDGVIGELSIPRLKLTAPVKVGDDENVLDASIGYLPDTPLPWTSGNSAFAAHRDRIFRPLKDIHAGDAIRLSTPHGELNYRVLKTMIVKPKDVWVLGPLPSVDLTLITCYPFYYVGSAPNRFVVQAEKVID